MLRSRMVPVIMVLLVVAAVPLHASPVTATKMALVTLEGDVEIAAAPAAAWSALTDPDKAQSWCPYWKDAKEAMPLTSVGATISYEDAYGNSGQSVVLFVDPGKELRVAHVPGDGSYVCQVKFILTPKGSGTAVHVIEQYSDALDVPLDKDTAASSKTSIAGYLDTFKRVAEGKAGK